MATIVAVIGVLLAACALGEKSEQAERIHGSLDEIAELDMVATITAELEMEIETPGLAALAGGGGAADDDAPAPELPEGVLEGGGLDDLLGGNSLAVVAELEPGAKKASLVVGDEPQPASVFQGDVLYVKRQNARDTERRRWAALDINDLEFDRPLGLSDLSSPALMRAITTTINPMFFIELVTGALAGSVGLVGDELVGDVETTRYDFNVSFDKAMTDLDFSDDERLTRLGLFRQFGMRKDVVHGSAWLDADGRLRRFRIELPVQTSLIEKRELTMSFDLHPADHNVFVTPPDPEITVTYETLGRLVRAALPEGL